MIKVTLPSNFNVFGFLKKALIKHHFQSDCSLSAIGFARRLANSTRRRPPFDGPVWYTSCDWSKTTSAVALGVLLLNCLYKHDRQSHFYQFVAQLSKILCMFKMTPEISGQKLAAFHIPLKWHSSFIYLKYWSLYKDRFIRAINFRYGHPVVLIDQIIRYKLRLKQHLVREHLIFITVILRVLEL